MTEVVEVLYINRSHGSDNDYITCKAENLVGRASDDVVLHVNCKSVLLTIRCHRLVLHIQLLHRSTNSQPRRTSTGVSSIESPDIRVVKGSGYSMASHSISRMIVTSKIWCLRLRGRLSSYTRTKVRTTHEHMISFPSPCSLICTCSLHLSVMNLIGFFW